MFLPFMVFCERTLITFQTNTLSFWQFICRTGKLATGHEKSPSIEEKKNWHIIFALEWVLLWGHSLKSILPDDEPEEVSSDSESENSLS